MSKRNLSPVPTETPQTGTAVSQGTSLILSDQDILLLRNYLKTKETSSCPEYTREDAHEMYANLRPELVPKINKGYDDVGRSMYKLCRQLPDWDWHNSQRRYTKEIQRRWISQKDAETDLKTLIEACRSKEAYDELLLSIQETLHTNLKHLANAVNEEQLDMSTIEEAGLKVRRPISALYTATSINVESLPSRLSGDPAE